MLDHELIRKLAQKALKQPKIAARHLRRMEADPMLIRAVEEYELNRGTLAEAASVANLMARV